MRYLILIATLGLTACGATQDTPTPITIGEQTEQASQDGVLTPEIVEVDAATGAPKKRGFFASVFGSTAAGAAAPQNPTVENALAEAIETSPPEQLDAPEQLDTPAQPRVGFFARLTATRAPAQHPDDVDKAGGQLPLGKIGRVCGVRKRNLGDMVQSAGGITLYDTDPNTLSARTFYLTGYSDGCPRKFTAGLAILGDPTLHEALRYSRGNTGYSDIDNAYETVKNRVCRVKRSQPCEKRRSALIGSTVFLSIYNRLGAPKPAGTLLFHKGKVVASDL